MASLATPRELDQDRVDAFGERLLTAINGAGLALMVSIGHRTRLFDTLAGMPPATSQEIADAAGLHERYVREWLGAMVTGQIVEYDSAGGRFHLPAEHAALLTRAAVPNNFAATMQWISVLGSVEDHVVERFQQGGGVPYECYCRFHEVMAEESAQTTLAGLIDHILPLEPTLAERMEHGIDVLDVGCGAGRAILFLAERFPRSRFAGYDFSEQATSQAQAEAQRMGLTNVRFSARDVTHLGERQQYDLITAFDAIHDQMHPDRVLAGIRQALRPDGLFLMQDIGLSSYVENNVEHPLGTFIYTISCMHCMTVSLAGGGVGLGAAWGEELACRMLAEAGFSQVRVERLPHDIQNMYCV